MVLPQHHNSFPNRTRFSCDDAQRQAGNHPYSRKLARHEQELAHRSVKSDPGTLSILMRASFNSLQEAIINTNSAKVVRRRQKNQERCKNRTINPFFMYMLGQTGNKRDERPLNDDVIMTRQPSSASLTSSTASLCSDDVETMTVISDTSTVCSPDDVGPQQIINAEISLPIDLLSIDGIEATTVQIKV